MARRKSNTTDSIFNKSSKELGRREIAKKRKGGFIWTMGAAVIIFLDWFIDKTEEKIKEVVIPFIHKICSIIFEWLVDIASSLVFKLDKLLDLLGWYISKVLVHIIRRVHDVRMKVWSYRVAIIKNAALVLVIGVGLVALFASVTNYEYSYNGKTLGIVREQRDVLEILDLVSEELSQEYSSVIQIDPENDIVFRPVLSVGENIDDEDTVLKKFTYMGDIQVQTYAIMVEGERIAILESEQIAQEVLESIKDIYAKGDRDNYEYVGFVENVKIEPYNTILANINSKYAAIKKIKEGKQTQRKYIVQEGDTPYKVALSCNLSLEELQDMNPKLKKKNVVLHEGDKLLIRRQVPILTVKTIRVSSFAETVKFDTVYNETNAYYVGEEIITRAGKNGKARITARLTKYNGETINREDLDKEILQAPISKQVTKGTRPVPPKKGTGSFSRPVYVGVYRGYGPRWGRMHYGLDYAASIGTPIHAADGGTVIKVGWSGAYGLIVKIDHGENKTTLYAHCSRTYVTVGEKVFKGQTIAAVGNTGRSTGPHCHFEIKINGANVNPAYYV